MTDCCDHLHMPLPTTVDLLPDRPATILWDGVCAFTSDDRTTDVPTFRGIGKATTVARLRALADMIEQSEGDD